MSSPADSSQKLTVKKTGKPKASVWKPAFLAALRETGNVTQSAEIAGITREGVYKARRRSNKFAEDWDSALEYATDALEREARRRAMQGVRRLKFHQGEMITIPLRDEDGKIVKDKDDQTVYVPYEQHEYSDTLLIFLLKAHRPEKFMQRSDITSGGKPLESPSVPAMVAALTAAQQSLSEAEDNE